MQQAPRPRLPLRDPLHSGGLQASDEAVPLAVRIDEDSAIRIFFSRSEGAGNGVPDCPGFAAGLLLAFRLVMDVAGTGIALEPACKAGMDVETNRLRQLATR